MPNTANKEFLENLIPPQNGEQRKAWFYRVGDTLGFCESTVRYYYNDKRAKHLSRLRAISGQISQKVHSSQSHLLKQGAAYDDTLGKLRELCREILNATDPTTQDRI